jgi:hypothetical protein
MLQVHGFKQLFLMARKWLVCLVRVRLHVPLTRSRNRNKATVMQKSNRYWRQALKTTTLSALVMFGGTAFAVSDWTVNSFSDSLNNGGCETLATNSSTNQNYGNTARDLATVVAPRPCSTGTLGGNTEVNFLVNAWSTTGSPTTNARNLPTGTDFETANLAWWSGSGFGVRNRAKDTTRSGDARYVDWASPNHSMDNSGQTDLIMLSFASPIVLESVLLGWASGDSDISVMRYVGPSSSTSPLNQEKSELTSAASGTLGGWELVGHYLGSGGFSGTTQTRLTGALNNVAAPDSSSYWLISAYNAKYGTAGKYGAQTGFDSTADMVKVLGIAGSASRTNQTPEPGSLALMGVAFVGMLVLRKRRAVSPA